MAFVDVPQLSDDWLRMRVGCVSASHVCDVMAKLKKSPNEAAARAVYRKKKVWESLTGLSAETYVSPYMDAGMETEPLARAAYEMERDIEVANGGLFIHDKVDRFVASPDGRVGAGLIEIKYLTGNTTEANHLDLWLGAEIPEEYRLQMLGQMSCSGKEWVDFVSFDPRLPRNRRLYVRRFHRDEAKISEIEQAVDRFNSEVDDLLLRLRQDDPSSLVPQLVKSLEAVAEAGHK